MYCFQTNKGQKGREKAYQYSKWKWKRAKVSPLISIFTINMDEFNSSIRKQRYSQF